MDNVERLGVRALHSTQPELPMERVVDFGPILAKIQEVADDAAQRAAQGATSRHSSALIATWMGIGTVLAIRLLLLLSILGAFTLAVMAMQKETNSSLFVLVSYSILVVLPLVYLSRFGRPESKASA